MNLTPSFKRRAVAVAAAVLVAIAASASYYVFFRPTAPSRPVALGERPSQAQESPRVVERPKVQEQPRIAASVEATTQAASMLDQQLARQPDRHARAKKFLAEWRQLEPDLAAKLTILFAKSLGIRSEGDDLKWTPEELARATELVAALPSYEDRLPFLSPLAQGFAQTDPVFGLELSEIFTIDSDREQIFREVLEGWTRADPKRATAWVVESPRGPVREYALSKLVTQLAAERPADAAHLARTAFDSPQHGADAAKTVMGRWAYKDPGAAAQWLNEFEAGELRRDLARMLVNAWKKKDEAGLKQWVGGVRNPTLREEISAALK